MKVTAYHGTDKCDFSRFDMKRVEPFNVGLHFGTKAAALARIAYLRENGRAASMRPPPSPNLVSLQRRTAFSLLIKTEISARNDFEHEADGWR